VQGYFPAWVTVTVTVPPAVAVTVVEYEPVGTVESGASVNTPVELNVTQAGPEDLVQLIRWVEGVLTTSG
jgi:hypothetical protein